MIIETQTIIAALGGFILGLIVLVLVMKIAAPGMMIHEANSLTTSTQPLRRSSRTSGDRK